MSLQIPDSDIVLLPRSRDCSLTEEQKREGDEYSVAVILWERNGKRGPRPKRPDWLEKRIQERIEYSRATDAHRRGEASTPPELPESMKIKRAYNGSGGNVIDLFPCLEAYDRERMIAIWRETRLDPASMRMLFDYRYPKYPPLSNLSAAEKDYCKALEKRLAAEKADRALAARRGNGSAAPAASESYDIH
jgi:hypothetical protein